MTKTTFLAAAAVLTSLIASPVMAQQSSERPMQNNDQGYNDRSFDHQMNNNDRDSGFWPGEAAAGMADSAVGAAGAIAAAPFSNEAYAYNDSYAYDDDQYMNDGQRASGPGMMQDRNSYGARNGFICQPGTWVRMEDRQRHLCQ